MADICHECENPAWTGRTIEAPALPSGGEGGTSNFNALDNRPKYDGVRMTGNTDIPNVSRDIERLDGDVEDIQGLIPETATPENQLADKDFVNSSVATNTANFVGTYNSLEELEAVENPSNNDYGFVISTDEQGNTVFNRYKYVSSVESWEFEYALNNSSFTAVQWAAINSGITEGNVEKINAILEIKSIGNGLVLENNGQLRQKLYTETGDNTDAAMDQKTVSDELDRIYGTARVLTAADYNANSSNWSGTDPANFNCVALWKLPAGVYTWATNFMSVVNIATDRTASSVGAMGAFVFTHQNNAHVRIYTSEWGGNDSILGQISFRMWLVYGSTGIVNSNCAYVSNDWIVNNLISEYTGKPLSAKQGKVLADMIGALSTLNTTAKTNVVAAINEVAGYKGQARVLTRDDYNWNSVTQTATGTLNSIAWWLLEPGYYVFNGDNGYAGGTEVVFSASSNSTMNGMGISSILVGGVRGNLRNVFCLAGSNFIVTQLVNATTGAKSGDPEYGLTVSGIINNLTTNNQYRPLSARQGVVLKGLIDGKQDALTAGNGIEIDNNVISIATISTEDWSALWQ